MIINVGVLSLFTTMVVRSNTLQAANGSVEIQDARERRMALAILRGFALAPIISPLSVTIAVILSALPQLTWTSMVLVTLPMSAFVCLLRWSTDWSHRTKHLARLLASQKKPPPLTPPYRFTGLAALTTISVSVGALVLLVPLPVAVLVAYSLCAFL